jgi:MscS family membrane protein
MNIKLMKPVFPTVAFQTTQRYHRTDGVYGATGTLVRGLMVSWAFFFAPLITLGQESPQPLKPPDRSSPRAALKTFLDSGDALCEFLAREYLPSPSHAKFQQLILLSETALQGLDLSQVPPASRLKIGRAAARDLYETLSRIQLPPLDAIPDTNSTRWVIPNTEIALVREQSGPHSGEFLFSPETVANASNFYERVHGLAYTRPVPLEHFREITVSNGGWMIPYAWIRAMPSWLRTPVAGQSGWKWIALALILSFFALFMRLAYRLSHRGSSQHPFLRALAQLSLPVFFLVAVPAVAYLTLAQVNLSGNVGSDIELVVTAVMYFAGAWVSWRFASAVAEAIIASPRIAPESIDAHLIKICTRLLGIVAAAALLGMGADRLGLPVYGIIAGLGVGGLAIALAAQPTIENLIGGLNLFADKPIQVGDSCRCGSDEGTVEAIGIRSTRIRGGDRTLTAIPNAALSKISIVNLTQRDRMLIKSVIGVRYETSPEQLRYLLVKIREMLLGHPRIHHDPARARFIGFGASSLDIEVFAYVMTRDRAEFLGIQEDVLLRVMDIVEQSGTGFAFPSQTLYFGRDNGLDTRRTEAAETQVRQWRGEGHLPFPNFSPDQMREIRGSLVYPPPGSTDASTAGSESEPR